MSVTPTGLLSLPLHRIRDAVVASPSWITWQGDAALAAAQTYLIAGPESLRTLHSIVDIAGDLRRTRDGVSEDGFIGNGGVLLYFCAPTLVDVDPGDAVTDFMNHVGAVMLDLERSSSLSGERPVIDEYVIDKGPSRIPPELRSKYGDMHEIQFLVSLTEWP